MANVESDDTDRYDELVKIDFCQCCARGAFAAACHSGFVVVRGGGGRRGSLGVFFGPDWNGGTTQISP